MVFLDKEEKEIDITDIFSEKEERKGSSLFLNT